MKLLKKTQPKKNVVKPRELSTSDLARVSGGEPLVCPVGTHHANGHCVPN